MSDPRHAESFVDDTDATAKPHPLDDLAERLSATPTAEPSPRRDLEHLVSMLAKRNIQTDDRLTNALEGLARWSDRAGTSRPADADQPIEPMLSAETERRFANSGAEVRMTAPARSLVESPLEQRPTAAPAPAKAPIQDPARSVSQAPRGGQPVASLRAALAQIAARQKDLDDIAPWQASGQAAPAVEPSMVGDLRREIDRLNSAIVDLPTRSEVDGLLKEIGALAVRNDLERPARLDADTMRSIEALVVEVERMRGEAASPHMIEHFAEELAALSAKLEAAGPSSADTLDVLAGRLDDVRAELAQFPRVGAVEELAADIQALVARLDGQERAADERASDAKLAEAAIRAEFASQSSTVAIDGVSRKLDALTEHLETQSTASGVHALPGKVDTLTGKLDALTAATLSRQADVERVADVVRAELAAFVRPDVGIADIAEKIEALTLQLATRPKSMEDFDELSAKIDGLGEKLGTIEAPGAAFDRIEDAVRGIAEHLVVTASAPASSAGLDGVESRIAHLVDSVERTDGRIDDLNAGFAALASRIEQSCAGLGAEAGRAAASAVRESFVEQGSSEGVTPTDLAEALGDIRSAASRNDRRTADTLDAVRLTLERLVERIETIAEPGERPATAFVERLPVDERPMTAAVPVIDATDAARAAHRKALSELDGDDEYAQVAPRLPQQASFAPEPHSAFDLPLEPGAGSRSWSFGETEAAPPQTAAALIAQARRANILPTAEAEDEAPAQEAKEARFGPLIATLKARRRPLLLALVAALIVVVIVKFASSLNDQPIEAAPEPAPQTEMRQAPAPAAPSAMEAPAAPRSDLPAQRPDLPAPRSEAPLPPPPPADREAPPAAAPPPTTPKPGAMLTPPRAPAADMTAFAFAQSLGSPAQKFADPSAGDDVTTGSISRSPDALPDAIGGSMLRLRAVQGDPSAQLEIADRLAEGRGVPSDPAAAARWLEKAASQGLAPAQHRLGSLYEKGRGVPRDIVTARRWYEQAAASGNVRAMHNLGVIHAEGGLGKPDFNAAIVWFRMAAERGLVDSQYNLAVLEARGLGGKRDLPDAYKWFALANAQGDQDAGRKRDDVGKELGAALPAARQAVAGFRPRMIDNSANEAPTPAGGWDQASVRSDPQTPMALR